MWRQESHRYHQARSQNPISDNRIIRSEIAAKKAEGEGEGEGERKRNVASKATNDMAEELNGGHLRVILPITV